MRKLYDNVYATYERLCYNTIVLNQMSTVRDSIVSDSATLTPEEVREIAELAKLDLSDEDVQLYAAQLTEILSYFQLLQEVDTSMIDPTATIIPMRSVMRADSDPAAITPDRATANAADAEANQFKVSAILGNE